MPRFAIRNLLLATTWFCVVAFIVRFAYSHWDWSKPMPVAIVIPLGAFIVAGPILFIALLTDQLPRGIKAALVIAALCAFTVGGAFAILTLTR